MTNYKVDDCVIVNLPKITNRQGNLTAINNSEEIDFEVKRVYYLYDIPALSVRGGHAHKSLQQLLVATSGTFEVVLNDGSNTKRIVLNQPFTGLWIKPGIWREIENFSSGATCLVLASNLFDEADYIRKFEDYLVFKHSRV